MGNVKRIYVEKKEPFAVKARELEEELKGYLGINGLEKVRVFIRYDVENLSDATFDAACKTVFSEPPVDILFFEDIEIPANGKVFSVEFLPGQFDQRADSAVQRPGYYGILRQGACQGRVRRFFFPQRRPAGNLRGKRLHRMGPHFLCLCPGRQSVHPHLLLLLHR